jgi:hypothetical protein
MLIDKAHPPSRRSMTTVEISRKDEKWNWQEEEKRGIK